MLDFGRARWDLAYFAEAFLGVRPHPGQVRLFESLLLRDPSGWRPAYLNLAVSAGNRAGKTLALAIAITHACLFKIGMKPPTVDDASTMTWMKAPYAWWHFGISQEVAGLVHNEMAMLFSGIHPAQQGRGCPLVDQAEAKVVEWQTKDMGMWPMVTFNPALGGAEVRFRTTGERAISSLGRDMNGISFDECGFEPHLSFIVDEVLHLRRLGTGGQLLLISTPTAGLTDFADIWLEGDPESPSRKPERMSLRMSTRDNIGYGIDLGIFERLIADMTPELIPQNIDGYFLQGTEAYFNAGSVDRCFVEGLPEERGPKDGKAYVQGVDPALSKDSAWSLVFEVDEDQDGNLWATGVRVRELAGAKTAQTLTALAVDGHQAYDVARDGLHSYCYTAMDATGFGGKLYRNMVEQVIPFLRNIEFGGSIQQKRKLLGDLRTMIDSGRLRMPRSGPWLKVRRQLLGYKLADRKIEQDAVMALACAVAEVKRSRAGTEAPVYFDARFPDAQAPAQDWVHAPFERPRRA